MYNDFFGFKEGPFQLVPNPGYFFLGRSHEEAIAHLNYAIAHGDGFVEITGEVGTGKTTLCRAFLEDLDENTEVAYIFNPRLNSIELLRSINDEFGVDSTADNVKTLIDTLNAFLIEKKARGKNALLLIDEAQNLDKDVLEQLRLLSNLETNTGKLLQMILVGQPELRKMLDSYELRQLRQRITLSWQLTPLGRHETRDYIRHRVKIASLKSGDMFTESAYRLIYKYSGGIPRLINIACDRALLAAYGFNRPKVTGGIAGTAIKELKTGRESSFHKIINGKMLTVFLALLCLALMGVLLFQIPTAFRPESTGKMETVDSASSHASSPPDATGKPGLAAKTSAKWIDFLGNLTGRSSRLSALKTAMSLWETTPVLNRYLDDMDDDSAFFQLAAAQNNFYILTVTNDWDLVKRLNLPAVLPFLPPGALSPRYLTLIEITGNELVFKGGEGETGEIIRVSPGEMKSYWPGVAYIPWKDFLNCRGDIPLDAPKESVLTLKMLLRDIGFAGIKLDHVYDDAARKAVEQIQEAHGIVVDGIVGARTKIVIYNQKKELKIPHITLNKN
ncbi:MAG: AAA family ATPase [Candidatus Aminicenantes bacterium]|nr:AAA family ATPase [Candidatus Aminicenantes bacterium]